MQSASLHDRCIYLKMYLCSEGLMSGTHGVQMLLGKCTVGRIMLDKTVLKLTF